MNLTEFLEELRQTRDGWTAGGVIRKRARLDDEMCPITAVCVRVKKTRFVTSQFAAAGERLGLSSQLTQNIVNAADYDYLSYRWMRSRLLKAVGLK